MARRDEGAYLQHVTEEQEASRNASAARAIELAIREPQGVLRNAPEISWHEHS
jgi:hypothetical protein